MGDQSIHAHLESAGQLLSTCHYKAQDWVGDSLQMNKALSSSPQACWDKQLFIILTKHLRRAVWKGKILCEPTSWKFTIQDQVAPLVWHLEISAAM